MHPIVGLEYERYGKSNGMCMSGQGTEVDTFPQVNFMIRVCICFTYIFGVLIGVLMCHWGSYEGTREQDWICERHLGIFWIESWRTLVEAKVNSCLCKVGQLCERVHNFQILSKRNKYTILACGGPRPSSVYLLQLGFTSKVNNSEGRKDCGGG